ncbi:unnamed protein product, partial [Mesorhabditis spiculigera]
MEPHELVRLVAEPYFKENYGRECSLCMEPYDSGDRTPIHICPFSEKHVACYQCTKLILKPQDGPPCPFCRSKLPYRHAEEYPVAKALLHYLSKTEKEDEPWQPTEHDSKELLLFGRRCSGNGCKRSLSPAHCQPAVCIPCHGMSQNIFKSWAQVYELSEKGMFCHGCIHEHMKEHSNPGYIAVQLLDAMAASGTNYLQVFMENGIISIINNKSPREWEFNELIVYQFFLGQLLYKTKQSMDPVKFNGFIRELMETIEKTTYFSEVFMYDCSLPAGFYSEFCRFLDCVVELVNFYGIASEANRYTRAWAQKLMLHPNESLRNWGYEHISKTTGKSMVPPQFLEILDGNIEIDALLGFLTIEPDEMSKAERSKLIRKSYGLIMETALLPGQKPNKLAYDNRRVIHQLIDQFVEKAIFHNERVSSG